MIGNIFIEKRGGKRAASVYKGYEKKSQFGDFWRRYRKNNLALMGLIILGCIILMALFANQLADYTTKVIAQDHRVRLLSPNSVFLLGTDAYGRDVLARIIHGARLSLTIGFACILSSMFIGLVLGALSGFYGGLVDNIIMRIADVFLAIPPILLAVAVVAVLGPSLVNLIIAMSIAYIPFFARVVRAPLLQIREKEFVEAARAVGAGDRRIIIRHILPNIVAPIVVQFSLGVADAIKVAAGLSFIGLGIQPPAPEWGTMLSEGKDYMMNYPYLVIFPGIILVITVLCLNLIGDGLQDALDPKLK